MSEDTSKTDSLVRAIALAPPRPVPHPLALAETSPEIGEHGLGRIGVGTRIRQYELIRELGRGGMGVIFLARDTKLGRRVAMKFLLANEPGFTDRILAEARATARCSHENIVVIHEVDEHNGRPYMVLEYLDGETLKSTLDRRRPTPVQAIEWMVPVVRALAHAHEFGIVHRDLKPSNVYLTSAGTVKVLDFGIAKIHSHTGEPERESRANDASVARSLPSGTIPYMAPEQFRTDVDQRTDLWAVGLILFEMLAGYHPLASLTPDALVSFVIDLASPMPSSSASVPDLPVELARLIDRCLKKRKEERFADARELLAALEPLLPRRLDKPRTMDVNPFPGLAPFEEADADRFFGRAQETARLLSRVRNQPITAVVGASGLGKSSFVRAGVIPALKNSGEAWEAFIVRPGRHPLASLASIISKLTTKSPFATHDALVERLAGEPGFLGTLLRDRAAERRKHILLYVDQFEELYTLVPDRTERLAFTACLSAIADDAATPLRLLLSMRSDFLDRVAEDPRFVEELTRGLFFLAPLAREGLEEALVQPLGQVGYRFETPDMVSEMLDALETTPGALPLLQFAASKLWDGRDPQRKLLTREAHANMGGVAGALAAHADEVIRALPSGRQKLARTVLTRLVTPEGTRATVDAAELEQMADDSADVRKLIDHLTDSRLLVAQTTGETERRTTLELVHESLIAAWPTLRRWLDDGREDLAFLAQLAVAARQWDSRGRPAGLLWRGEAAAEARHWRSRFAGELAPREAQFLSAVFALYSRSARIRRAVVLGTIGVLLVIVAAGAVALTSIRRAKLDAVDQASRAIREAERARSAESRIKDQLGVIANEQRAKEKAREEVEHGKAQLDVVNRDLQDALVKAKGESQKAEDESKHARDAAARAQTLADSLKRSNEQLERLLAEEKAHAQRLEEERKKIGTRLK